jgi:prepilin-type N-terminal cleavage/methylation domain-containing protein
VSRRCGILKVLMVKISSRRGFTLIEIIVVMAITGSLLVIAFVGQRSLRSRAQFDASVNKFVASVADARNQALAGVNIVGSGNGTGTCPSGGSGKYIFAGVAWTADASMAAGPVKMDYYKADPGVAACVFSTEQVRVSGSLTVNKLNPPASRGGRILFVRTSTGAVNACPVTDLTANVPAVFTAASCAAGSLTLNLEDDDNHTAVVTIDSNGLARRQN